MTKAEREQHEARLAESAATVADLDDEKRSRRLASYIGGAALAASIVIGVSSCGASISAMNVAQLAADRERDRAQGEVKLRCVDNVSRLYGQLIELGNTVETVGQPFTSAGLDGLYANALSAMGSCAASGDVDEDAVEALNESLATLYRSVTATVDEQDAALIDLVAKVNAAFALHSTDLPGLYDFRPDESN